MIKLVMTDLDDTLIAAGNKCVSDRALEGIRACLDAGVRFGSATGRMPYDLDWMFGYKDWAYQTSACCNGMIVHLDGKHVHTAELDRPSMERVIEVVRDFPGCVLVLHRDGRQFGIGDEPPTVVDDGVIARNPNRTLEMIPTLYGEPLVKANVRVEGGEDVRLDLKEALAEACPKLGFVYPNPKMPLIDIVPAGWGKAQGIRVLCDTMGIGIDEVAVFGDSENDLDMIGAFPNSVAVANAMPVIADTARWHIGASADDAVADALFDIASATSEGRMPSFMKGDVA